MESGAEIGFACDSPVPGWSRLGLPCLSNVAGPMQHFRSAMVDAWKDKVSGELCKRKGVWGGHLIDHRGSFAAS